MVTVYQPSNLKKRLGVVGIGLSANWIMVWTFDFVLYPFVIFIGGVLWGGLIMTFLSFITCYLTLLFYDWAKKDWIGIETLKSIKELNALSRIGKFLSRIVKKSDPLAMIVLSIQFDPFITVAYMRHGAHKYNGLSGRDWRIFITSLILSNIYWTLAAYMGITLIEATWFFIS